MKLLDGRLGYAALALVFCVMIFFAVRDLTGQQTPAETVCAKVVRQGADSCQVSDTQYEARVIVVDENTGYLVVYQGSKVIGVLPLP
jgi:hypothetical protein